MLFKLVIADDEKKIRDGLIKFVDWISLGFEIVADFQDGSEVLEYIKTHHVDVILTDIKMVHSSGLDVAKHIFYNKLPIKVILISGYADFDYAKKGIEYNVFDYLLKPTELPEIKKVFTNLYNLLVKDFEQNQVASNDMKIYDDVLPLLKKQFINDLLMGAIRKNEDVQKYIKILKLNINPEKDKCVIVKVSVPDFNKFTDKSWKYSKEDFYNAVQNFIVAAVKDMIILSAHNFSGDMQFVAIHKELIDIKTFAKEIEDKFSKLQTQISEMMGTEIYINIESIYNSIFEIVKSNDSIDMDRNKTRDYISCELNASIYGLINEQQKLLISYISEGNVEAVDNLFISISSKIQYTDIKVVKSAMSKLYEAVYDKLKKVGLDIQLENLFTNNYNQLLNLNDNQEIINRVKSLINNAINIIKNSQGVDTTIVEKAKAYIEKNFNKDISLEDVAGYVYLNATYFSRIFKENMGENFIDYLIKLRIKKAKQLLLNQNYKVYEVCDMVGYKTTKYFYKLFKEYTGYTPTEYRNKMLGGNDE